MGRTLKATFRVGYALMVAFRVAHALKVAFRVTHALKVAFRVTHALQGGLQGKNDPHGGLQGAAASSPRRAGERTVVPSQTAATASSSHTTTVPISQAQPARP